MIMQAKKMVELKSASDIANQIGVHKTTINRIAKSQNIGQIIGQQRVFDKKDADRIKSLCKIRRGNPNFLKKANQ